MDGHQICEFLHSDAFGRLYDRRMLPPLSSSQTKMKLPPCVTYFCPVHLAERVSLPFSSGIPYLYVLFLLVANYYDMMMHFLIFYSNWFTHLIAIFKASSVCYAYYEA